MSILENTLENCIKDFVSAQNGKIIYVSKTGSHLHGSSSDKSDVDIKGIFLPNVEKLILQEHHNHYQYKFIESGKLHEVTFISVQEFLNKILKMECNAIELLFSMDSDKIILETEHSKYLREKAIKLLTKNVSSFIGMANAEITRYECKKQRNTGKDIAHGVRSAMQAVQFLEHEKLFFPLPKVEMIKKIKYGQTPVCDAYFALKALLEVLVNPKEKPSVAQENYKKQLILDLYKF